MQDCQDSGNSAEASRPTILVGKVRAIFVLGGSESTRKGIYLFENRRLARGLATCAFDDPGQSEMYFQAKMRPDFHRVASAVVDSLERRPHIDTNRISVLGLSLGGKT